MKKLITLLFLITLLLVSCNQSPHSDKLVQTDYISEGIVSEAMNFVGVNPKAYVFNRIARYEDGQIVKVEIKKGDTTESAVAMVETSLVEYDALNDGIKNFISENTEGSRACKFQHGHSFSLKPDKIYVEFSSYIALSDFKAVKYELRICKGSEYSSDKDYAKGFIFSDDFSYEYISKKETGLSFKSNQSSGEHEFKFMDVFRPEGYPDSIAFAFDMNLNQEVKLTAWYSNGAENGKIEYPLAQNTDKVVVIMPYADYGTEYSSRYRYEFSLAVGNIVVDSFIVDMARAADINAQVPLVNKPIPSDAKVIAIESCCLKFI